VAATAIAGYLFNALGKSTIKALYNNTGKELKGHHVFDEKLAAKYDDVIAPETVNRMSQDRIGQGYVGRPLEGDPHHGYSSEHRAATEAIDAHMAKWVEDGKISKENPMTQKQYFQFKEEVAGIPAVGSFWKAITDFADLMLQKGYPPKLKGMPAARGRIAIE
jgi:hypothetical protein